MEEKYKLKITNSEATINHIKNLAYNRSTGTVGETEAVLYIQKCLQNQNIKSKIEYFSFTGALRTFMRLSYVIICTYLIIYKLILILTLYFPIKYCFERTRNFSLVEKEYSKNLVAKIPARSKKNNRPVIILTAHYDSFSAPIPYRLQSVFIFIFRTIIFPYFLITMAFSVWFLIEWISPNRNRDLMMNIVIITTLIEYFLVIIILLFIYNTKRSFGSIDNASGISILIELAKIFDKNPLENYDVIFLWSGAEEYGLIGSKKFCKKYANDLDKNYNLGESFNITIDMVGTYIGLLESKTIFRKNSNSSLNNIIKNTANKLDIPIIAHKKKISPKSDHISFIKFARKLKVPFQVALFHSAKDSKYIHSNKDTPDKCSIKNLNGCLEICYDTIRLFDLKTTENS